MQNEMKTLCLILKYIKGKSGLKIHLSM